MPLNMDAAMLRQIDLMRDIALLGVGGAQRLLRNQVDYAKDLMALSGEQSPDAPFAASERWLEMFQSGVRAGGESAGEFRRLGWEIQSQLMRLVERQSSDAQAILMDAETRVLAALSAPGATGGAADATAAALRAIQRVVRSSDPEQRLAA